MTWVNSGGAVSGGPTVTGPYASAADLQALKTDGGQGGSVLVTATGSSTARSLADWMVPLDTTAGTPSATTFLRGDKTWAVPAGGGGGGLSGMADGTTAAGVDPTGATDSTTGIQNVLNANAGKAVWFGPGTYLISSVITVPDGTIVWGMGNEADPTRGGTTFVSAQADFSFFTCANRCVFHGLNFDKVAQTITSGAVIKITGIYCRLIDIYMNAAFGGVVVKPGAGGQSAAHHFRGIAIHNVVSGGAPLDLDGSAASGNVDGVNVTDFQFNSSIDGTTTSTMIYLRGHVEGVVFANGVVVGGGYSLQTSSRSWAMGQRPAHNNFVNVHFDAARFGSVLTDTFNIEFTNCWFSAGMAGGGSGNASSHGVTLNRTDTTVFSACVFGNSYGHGVNAPGPTTRLRLLGCSALGNNGGAIGAHGIAVGSNNTDFVIQGCTATNVTGFSGVQGYGILINGGTSDRYIVADNLVSGNGTGGVSDGGSGVNKRVANNY